MFVFVDYVTCLQMHVLIVLMHFRVEVKSEGNMRMLKACTKHDDKHAFYFISRTKHNTLTHALEQTLIQDSLMLMT